MNEQKPFDESRLRIPLESPGSGVRKRVLSSVNTELRCGRRDRRRAWFSVSLILFAGVANMVIGQRETARLARWYAVPSSIDRPVFVAAKPDRPLGGLALHHFRPIYFSSWGSPNPATEIDADQQQILEWIWEHSGEKGAS